MWLDVLIGAMWIGFALFVAYRLVRSGERKP